MPEACQTARHHRRAGLSTPGRLPPATFLL